MQPPFNNTPYQQPPHHSDGVAMPPAVVTSQNQQHQAQIYTAPHFSAGSPSQSAQSSAPYSSANVLDGIKTRTTMNELTTFVSSGVTQAKEIRQNMIKPVDDFVNKINEDHNYSVFVDILIKLMNFNLLLFKPRKFSNFRWANAVKDHINIVQEFTRGQMFKVYGRITSRYKFHKLQMYINLPRRFNATIDLQRRMSAEGNAAFYANVCGSPLTRAPSRRIDLTRIDQLTTRATTAEYLAQQIRSYATGPKVDQKITRAMASFARGFSRPVVAEDFTDWEMLRNEIRRREHVGVRQGGLFDDDSPNDVVLVAVSYKNKEVKIMRHLNAVDEDGNPLEGSQVANELEWAAETIELTWSFFDDFRWSQLIRSCAEIARKRQCRRVRLWIDQLVTMGFEPEEKKAVYTEADWSDFGTFAYVVCPVVRLYERNEPDFNTDFWRKLETVMGVAGCGIYVDDYVLRKYDKSLFYGPEVYSRLQNGISCIGGNGVFVRAVTLAVATALLTDGLSVSQANEDKRTAKDASSWKAWALRTISEGAYSSDHSSIMCSEDPYTIGLAEFKRIVFWESYVSNSNFLEGCSYLDSSFQKSMAWKKFMTWDGVVEWVGMMSTSCIVQERESIMDFLTQSCRYQLWTTTSGHVAALMNLTGEKSTFKRSIAVDLARYSSARKGHVTAVAEATGLWGETLLPPFLTFIPDADVDQTATIEDGVIHYEYKDIPVSCNCCKICKKGFGLLFILLLISIFVPPFWAIFVLVLIFKFFGCCKVTNWPWCDFTDVGEVVFDNLLMHGLFKSGIKEAQYRRLRVVPYKEIVWF